MDRQPSQDEQDEMDATRIETLEDEKARLTAKTGRLEREKVALRQQLAAEQHCSFCDKFNAETLQQIRDIDPDKH